MENDNIVLVSVIVPVYNVEKYLSQCLNSLVKQTLKKIEIVVVNDGSTDSSQIIIDQFAEKYPDMIISVIKENGGLGDARNKGLEHSHGKYVMFVDSDDWLELNAVETLYNYSKKTNSDVVIFDFTSIYDGWEQGWCSTGYRGESSPASKSDFLLNSMNPATACNKFYRKELFCDIAFTTGWYEDVATIPVLLSYCNKITYLPNQLYYYRQREGSIIQSSKNKRSLDVINAWEHALKFCDMNWKKHIIFAVYYSISVFIEFKPEFADEYLSYFRKNEHLFSENLFIMVGIKENSIVNLFSKQLIPKKIHYFWFGSNPKSDLIIRCIDTWKKFAPDFEIIEWNESNCNVNECTYVKQAYENKRWAFVADYFRVKQIASHGGFYMDTDVELTADISILRLNNAFFAFEAKKAVNAAIFGAVPDFSLIKDWYETYLNSSFILENGKFDTSNTIVIRLTNLLKSKYNISMNGQTQILKDDIKIYAPNILTLDIYDGKNIAQHHYDASWWDVKTGQTSYKYEVLKSYFTDDEVYNDNINAELQRAYIRISELENSTCWKITKPIRILLHFIRKLKISKS